jgi:hypothetical protein
VTKPKRITPINPRLNPVASASSSPALVNFCPEMRTAMAADKKIIQIISVVLPVEKPGNCVEQLPGF